jgi:hypothetical protein
MTTQIATKQTLEQIATSTLPIFENKELVLPEPPVRFKDQLAALDEASLPRQRTACLFEMRQWQAKEMGFVEIAISEIVAMLMGESHTDYKDGETHKIEWVYNHHNDEVSKTWTSKTGIYYRMEKKGLWHLPPFAKRVKWEVQHGRLDYIKRELPYGVVLRINELKKLKLFNSFAIVAPMAAWLKQSDIDPIVIANIYQIPADDKGDYTNAGNIASYFVAKW